MTELVTIDHLRDILVYCHETGTLTWKTRGPETFQRCHEKERNRVSSRWNAIRAGRVAGHVGSTGYRDVFIEKRTYKAHRIAWAIFNGDWPSNQIDHINQIKDDNRIANLRSVSGAENCRNRKRPKTNTSGQVGVHFHVGSGQWVARAMVNGRRTQLGSFATKSDAVKCRQEANERLGFHENHGA